MNAPQDKTKPASAIAVPGRPSRTVAATIDSLDLKVISLPLSMPLDLGDVDTQIPAPYIAIVGEAEPVLPFYGGPEARASASPHTTASAMRKKAI